MHCLLDRFNLRTSFVPFSFLMALVLSKSVLFHSLSDIVRLCSIRKWVVNFIPIRWSGLLKVKLSVPLSEKNNFTFSAKFLSIHSTMLKQCFSVSARLRRNSTPTNLWDMAGRVEKYLTDQNGCVSKGMHSICTYCRILWALGELSIYWLSSLFRFQIWGKWMCQCLFSSGWSNPIFTHCDHSFDHWSVGIC